MVSNIPSQPTNNINPKLPDDAPMIDDLMKLAFEYMDFNKDLTPEEHQKLQHLSESNRTYSIIKDKASKQKIKNLKECVEFLKTKFENNRKLNSISDKINNNKVGKELIDNWSEEIMVKVFDFINELPENDIKMIEQSKYNNFRFMAQIYKVSQSPLLKGTGQELVKRLMQYPEGEFLALEIANKIENNFEKFGSYNLIFTNQIERNRPMQALKTLKELRSLNLIKEINWVDNKLIEVMALHFQEGAINKAKELSKELTTEKGKNMYNLLENIYTYGQKNFQENEIKDPSLKRIYEPFKQDNVNELFNMIDISGSNKEILFKALTIIYLRRDKWEISKAALEKISEDNKFKSTHLIDIVSNMGIHGNELEAANLVLNLPNNTDRYRIINKTITELYRIKDLDKALRFLNITAPVLNQFLSLFADKNIAFVHVPELKNMDKILNVLNNINNKERSITDMEQIATNFENPTEQPLFVMLYLLAVNKLEPINNKEIESFIKKLVE